MPVLICSYPLPVINILFTLSLLDRSQDENVFVQKSQPNRRCLIQRCHTEV
jgi:hypothetical protein